MKFRSKVITSDVLVFESNTDVLVFESIFLLNILWSLLFKCSKIGFGSVMGFVSGQGFSLRLTN